MSTQSGRSTSDTPSPSSLSKSLSDASIQSLSSILNNPHLGKSGVYSSDSSWTTWFSSPTPVAPQPDFPPILPSLSKSDVARSDFSQYLSAISQNYSRFEDILNHKSTEQTLTPENVGQGDSLLACLREVPSLYFKEDFALEDGPTFRAACPFTNVNDNVALQEKLSHYLDVVELHLVKEISLRSNSFFEAQGQLQDLNVKIVEGCSRIRELKETIRLLDKDLVESARNIQELNCSRSNLLVLQHKLRLILYVNQALNALKLLVASADCAGALDVTNDLQNLLDGDELTGLHCFRHLRDHVATSIDSVNSILSADFMRAAIHDAGDTDVLILSKAKARASFPMNGYDTDVRLDEEETSSFRDLLLPIIIGLLRTAKLPSVLRMYRDTLTADMKTAIKTAVAELLPILLVRPMESDFTPGERTVDGDGGGSLASKLRGLSSESFVHLLGAIFRIVQAHLVRAAEVKKAIEWIMSNLDGHFAADSVAAAIAIGAAAAEKTQESDGQVGSTFSLPSQRTSAKLPSQGKANDASVPSHMSRNFRADVLRENAEAVFAACDAAHGRWAKLLAVRALLHPKLRLQEFLSIYNITQDFITSTEKIGGRLGYSIRGTLQSQAKAFVDFQHEMRMTKIKAVLDQETWVEIDVPDEFQAIVASLFTSEAAISGDLHDAKSNLISSYVETVANNDGLLVDGTEASNTQLVRTDSSEVPMQNDGQVKSTSPESTENSKTSSSSHAVNSDNVRKKGKSVCRTVLCGGVSYHMVNCGLILLKMLSEYVDMNSYLPALSSEVVHRVVELLKFFNTRTAQLVLGAGAMQVSGLKKITAKHLALASQVISFTSAIIPEIRRTLFHKVPETRKMLLMSEIDRVAQDYRVHRDEIHTKLVQIMRERVLTNLSHLPPILESWNRPEDADSQPSQVVRAIVKEVGFLQRVVSQTLHESDAQAIHRQVVAILHSQISEAYSRVEISSPQAKEGLRRDVEHILGCIRSLPTDDSGSDTPNWGRLDEFLVQKFGTEAG